MKKRGIAVALALVLAVSAAVAQVRFSLAGGEMGNLALVRHVPGGGALVAEIDRWGTAFSLTDTTGTVQKTFRLPEKRDGLLVSVADAAISGDGTLYLLEDLSDPFTGQYERQELGVYNLNAMYIRRLQRHKPELTLEKDASVSIAVGQASQAPPSQTSTSSESAQSVTAVETSKPTETQTAANPESADAAPSHAPKVSATAPSGAQGGSVRYRWISAGSSVIVMGVDAGGSLVRDAFEPETLNQRGGMVSKMTRRYPLDKTQDIFQVVPQGSNVVYSSRSGKVFLTSEGAAAPRELYPAKTLDRLMYPLFLTPGDSSAVMVGEQESGDLLSMETSTGQTTILKKGTEPFSGVNSYAPVNLVSMSRTDAQNYVGVVQNQTTLNFELILCENGTYSVVERLRPSLLGGILMTGIVFLGVLAVSLPLLLLLQWFFRQLRGSRTILFKLAFSTIPMLAFALLLFGTFSFYSYSRSINQSYEKQVVDEGNLLTALFGTESFGEIEFPYDYGSEAYNYLSNMMGTRQVFTRTAYFERSQYFTGVDNELPPFYPLGITLNRDTRALYEKATRTGEAVTGVITDQYGRRLSCVTPIGGTSGETVYLLETGVHMANITSYTSAYLRNYALVSLLFVSGVSLLLLLFFKRILRPINRIKKGMEEFSKGNRAVRLENETGDELSDISRVFNKMADDIDAQIFNLKNASDNYFRFIPPKLFRLLGKQNLGELELGSSIEGSYCVLTAVLPTAAETNYGLMEYATNRFFGTINKICAERDATLITDSMDLHRLQIICPDGEVGIQIALSVLAYLGGGENTEAFFVLHRAELSYCICGDRDRYVPAMLSREMQWLAAQEPFLRRLASRLVVTAPACETIDRDKYSSRFIGQLEDGGRSMDIYDFYDASPPEICRKVSATRPMFDKAMALYGQDRYYDAKNLFAMVLRENPTDHVTRYYLFICEQRL